MLAPWEAGLFGHFTKLEPEDLGTEGPKSCGRSGAGGARATVKISKSFSCSWKKRVQAKKVPLCLVGSQTVPLGAVGYFSWPCFTWIHL